MTCNSIGSNAVSRNHLTVVNTPGEAQSDAAPSATIDAASFPESALADLYTCWRGFGRHGEVPARAAIDPTALPRKLLPNLSIIERLPPDEDQGTGERFRYRLAGTAIEQAAGRTLTWCYFDELLPANRYGRHVHWQLRTLLARRAAVYSEGAYLTSVDGKLGVRTTCHLMLPLTDEAGEIRYVLAAQTFGTLSNLNHAPFLLADDFRPGRTAVVRGA
ncbi:PAS domain-containing protein [Algihabitans albus]|uniref:PAS domain-containing protein n=1 Tax=Algihabitans albus TaxID=2164067 RepID=UPI0035CFB1F0